MSVTTTLTAIQSSPVLYMFPLKNCREKKQWIESSKRICTYFTVLFGRVKSAGGANPGWRFINFLTWEMDPDGQVGQVYKEDAFWSFC